MLNLKRDEQIRTRLLHGVLNLGLPEGAPLPSIRALARQLGTSVRTVQSAVDRLKREGLIVSRPGAGLYVKDPAPRTAHRKTVVCLHAGKPGYLEEGPYPSRILRALRASLQEHGYALRFHSLDGCDPFAWSESLRGQRLAGAVLFEIDSAFVLRELQELRLPVVSMDFDCSRMGVPSVCFDNHCAAIDLANDLLARGHRRIAFVQMPYAPRFGISTVLDAVAAERYEGYRIALRMAGLEPLRIQLAGRGTDAKGLAEAVLAQACGARETEPTAFVCPSFKPANRLAAGLIALGHDVPGDFSVATFGNPDAPFDGRRKLTAARLAYEAMGRKTAELLVAVLKGEAPALRTDLPSSVVQRNSVAAPATGHEELKKRRTLEVSR